MNGRPITIPEDVRAVIEQAARRGDSVEQLAQRMADMRLEKIVAIKLLCETKKMRLQAAKEAIHYSPAWAFRRASDEAFHESLYATAVKAGLLKDKALEDGSWVADSSLAKAVTR